jgi:ribosomal protein S18 acetylase RimI-like enzyme
MPGQNEVPRSSAADYAAVEQLRDGRRLEIRALRPDDQAELLAAVDRTSAQSLYRRFFGVKRHFTDKEVDFFVNVDFVDHVALVALVAEDRRPRIVGGGRYVVVESGKAELAFAVIDDYQGQSIGRLLMRHLIVIARNAGLVELVADVLPSNSAMLKVFQKSGLPINTRRADGIMHVSLQLT